MFLFLCLFHLLFPAALIMTKRDSQLAELLSPRVLRMESFDVDSPMDPVMTYVISTMRLGPHVHAGLHGFYGVEYGLRPEYRLI